jgi:5'-methylthioadenosine phosphorylase
MSTHAPSSASPPGVPFPGAIGLFGGSGLYDLDALQDVREVRVSTPFGEPSAPPRVGKLAGRTLIFIPRHGRGHRFLPSEINYRANVHALKQLGAERVISVSAVGSLREEVRQGDFVLVDQFIDRTYKRATSFFGEGCAGHVAFADPVCDELLPIFGGLAESTPGENAVHTGGTYICMEGPQFSTRAEALFHRSLGATVIGMTGATEAKLCREAELCFSLIAIVTDYDCWHPEEENVTADSVLEVLTRSIVGVKHFLKGAVGATPEQRRCSCGTAAKHAIMTNPEAISAEARERLRTLYGRYLG